MSEKPGALGSRTDSPASSMLKSSVNTGATTTTIPRKQISSSTTDTVQQSPGVPMLTPTRSFASRSFGSTRGTGLDSTPSRASPSTATLLKRRLSNRADLLHSPVTDPNREVRLPNGVLVGGIGNAIPGSPVSGGGVELDHRAILTMKSTVNVTGEELEDLVSMGERAYVDSKVAQTVAQFRRILTTPRGRVALKSQQYLHEMTNETLDAQRRLLFEVRQRTRVRAKQIYAGLVEKLRQQAQASRLQRFLDEDFDYYDAVPEGSAMPQQLSSANEFAASDSDLSRTGTATATEEETGPQLSRKPSLQYSDVSSDRGKNRPFQFGGSQEHHHRRRTSSELSAASRGSHGSRHSMQQETSRGGGGGGGADDATLPESRTPGPQEGSVSGSGLPPRPPDKVKKFEVHYSDGTTATVFASEVSKLFQDPDVNILRMELLDESAMAATDNASHETEPERRTAHRVKRRKKRGHTKRSKSPTSPGSKQLLKQHGSGSSFGSRDGTLRSDTGESYDPDGDDSFVGRSLFLAFQAAVDVKGVDYKPVRNYIQTSLQRGLSNRERGWVRAQLRVVAKHRQLLQGGDAAAAGGANPFNSSSGARPANFDGDGGGGATTSEPGAPGDDERRRRSKKKKKKVRRKREGGERHSRSRSRDRDRHGKYHQDHHQQQQQHQQQNQQQQQQQQHQHQRPGSSSPVDVHSSDRSAGSRAVGLSNSPEEPRQKSASGSRTGSRAGSPKDDPLPKALVPNSSNNNDESAKSTSSPRSRSPSHELLPHSAGTIINLGATKSQLEPQRGAADDDDEESDFARVAAFYEEYFPKKVKELPQAFQQFAGKEKEMKFKVIQKYLDEAREFFSPAEVKEALLEQALREQVLTRQMGMIQPVVNSDGESDSEVESSTDNEAFGKFSFH